MVSLVVSENSEELWRRKKAWHFPDAVGQKEEQDTRNAVITAFMFLCAVFLGHLNKKGNLENGGSH